MNNQINVGYIARSLLGLGALLSLLAVPVWAKESTKPPKHVEFSFEGPFGTFDRGSVQRGFLAYQQVCANCHSMNLLSYRNLGEKGGPFECVAALHEQAAGEAADKVRNKAEAAHHPKPVCYKDPNANPILKAIVAQISVGDRDANGEPVDRPARVADRFRRPFPTDEAARTANGGALPPDLSVIVKARHHGPFYIYSLLLGYENPPAGLTPPAGKHYNPYFPGDVGAFWSGPKDKIPVGGLIAMPPQLENAAQSIEYPDGTKVTEAQLAHDVVTFLAWASDPHAETRKKTGLVVLAYLVVLAGLLFLAYRSVWRGVKH